MQYRKHLPDARLHDLIDIFRSRKEFFLEMIYKAERLVNKEKSLKKGVIKEEDHEEHDISQVEVKEVELELEEYGFMMTKVRAAFRLYIHKAA
jgi:hypothetical protein